jgi:hypothetical protein
VDHEATKFKKAKEKKGGLCLCAPIAFSIFLSEIIFNYIYYEYMTIGYRLLISFIEVKLMGHLFL